MTDETLQQEIEWLEQQGWQADATVQAVERRHRFPSFADTLNFLIELGDLTAPLDAVPTIHIDGGTEVNVRVGRGPAPALTGDEIRLAKAAAGETAAGLDQDDDDATTH